MISGILTTSTHNDLLNIHCRDFMFLHFSYENLIRPPLKSITILKEISDFYISINNNTNSNIKYERSADVFNCLNDPQIIANWNQTVIYVAHFIRNMYKSTMPCIRTNQFNRNTKGRKKGRLFVVNKVCCVCRVRRSADIVAFGRNVYFLFIYCEFLWMIAVIPLNDIFHADDFWRLLITSDFRTWLVSGLETDALEPPIAPNNVQNIKLIQRMHSYWPVRNAFCINM